MKTADLTISDVAAELRIRREHVVRLLKLGVLPGYDATPPGARRKSYRITRNGLDTFKAKRSAKQHKPAKQRSRTTRDPSFVEYF